MTNNIHMVISGQSLLDLANQYAGTIEAVVEIAQLNNLSITSTLTPGQQIFIPKEFEHFNREVVDYFNRKNIQLASNGTDS